jgi:hypothetical protein
MPMPGHGGLRGEVSFIVDEPARAGVAQLIPALTRDFVTGKGRELILHVDGLGEHH